MKIPESLRPILKRLKNVRFSHGDCWRATCPCGSDELRIFELGLEVRCGSCRVTTFGVEQFLERFTEEKEARELRPETIGGSRLNEGSKKEVSRKVEAPKPKKPTRGSCEVCGAEFEILPYTRRKKRFCSGKHQKAMERQRKREGRDLGNSPQRRPVDYPSV